LRQTYLVAASFLAAVVVTPVTAHADERNPWNGLYVGVNGGYAWQDVGGVFDGSDAATDLSGIDLNGAVIGGQLGYNFQSGQFLLGIEGDASVLTHDDTVFSVDGVDTESLTGDLAYLASIRGRLGWAINNWLLYGTVGWGAAEFKFTENAPSVPFTGTVRIRDQGVVFGGGVEWMLAYGVSVRGEYLRYDLGKSTTIPGSFPDVDPGDNASFDNIDVARAALNIKLSP
jgi:outer membrane immunogenic protein